MNGVWVTVTNAGGTDMEGLIVAIDARAVTVLEDGEQERSMYLMGGSIVPCPMPEPPDKSIMEWMFQGATMLAYRDGDAWFVAGQREPNTWTDLGLGIVERPVNVVRWGP